MTVKLPRLLTELEPAVCTTRKDMIAAMKAADIGPGTQVALMPATSCPLVVLRYAHNAETGRYMLTRALAQVEADWYEVTDHLYAVGNLPVALQAGYNPRVFTQGLENEDVYVLGQLVVQKADMPIISNALPKITTSFKAARYYLRSAFKKDWKLSKFMHFRALDQLFLREGRLRRCFEPRFLSLHLEANGFRTFNTHLGSGLTVLTAKQAANSFGSNSLLEMWATYRRRNTNCTINRVLVLPVNPADAIASVISIQKEQ